MICLYTGTICNYDILPTTTSQLALRYYCVPKSQCNLNRQRSPIMPQSWRLCNEYLTPPQADDALICCHNADINDTNTVHWDHNNVYLPGLRSWLSKSLGQHSYHRNYLPYLSIWLSKSLGQNTFNIDTSWWLNYFLPLRRYHRLQSSGAPTKLPFQALNLVFSATHHSYNYGTTWWSTHSLLLRRNR